jgi:hypothetical protein
MPTSDAEIDAQSAACGVGSGVHSFAAPRTISRNPAPFARARRRAAETSCAVALASSLLLG